MRERTEGIVRRLGERAEEACRRYLSNGRKVGNYWIVGDCRNAKGRSLYVRLKSNGNGRRGKWADGSSGEHGDILDIIATAIGAASHNEALIEAEKFLGITAGAFSTDTARDNSSAAARLFYSARSIAGTLAETYLRSRCIDSLSINDRGLRFHPQCYRREISASPDCVRQSPALLAAVRDDRGRITGVMRTYLRNDSSGSPIIATRRALGALAGNAVRLGPHAPTMVAGEGIETMLSLHMAMPAMSTVAALSAAHLAAWVPPSQLRRLYIAVDQDLAGRNAAARLQERLAPLGVEVVDLIPRRNDFNDDLIADGLAELRAHLADQLIFEDRERFLRMPRRTAR